MINNQQSVKRALLYGFIGAAAFVLIYECYANVMQEISIALALAGCVFVAAKLCRYKLSDALTAASIFMIISVGLGVFLEIMLHDSIVSFLEKNSKYFYLGFKEVMYYALKVAACYIVMFMVIIGKAGLMSAISKIKNNSERSATFIENAFSDDE